jgi:hypothetical protein
VLTAASGGWWGGPKDSYGIPSADSQDGSPNGFHVLSVEGSHYTTRFVPAVGKGTRQLRAVVDGPRAGASANGCAATFAPDELKAGELVVNVFDGGPATRVTFEIAGQGGPPVPMQRTITSRRCLPITPRSRSHGYGQCAHRMSGRCRFRETSRLVHIA